MPLLTPEEARGWRTLRSFDGQKSPAEQKAQRAKEKLLDETAAPAGDNLDDSLRRVGGDRGDGARNPEQPPLEKSRQPETHRAH